jgi:hypothetical protein
MSVTDAYVNYVREHKSPQFEIIECLLDDLNKKSSLVDSKAVNYIVSSKILQRNLKEKTGRTVSSRVIGRSIKAFFIYFGLEEGKDYEFIRGHSNKYLLEKLHKSKIEEMNKFRDV